MKLLFLDIDGVLNCNRSVDDYVAAKKAGNRLAACSSYYFAPWSVAALNRITHETGARIVISSSWRDIMHVVHERFQHFGITGRIIGRTPLGIQVGKSGLYNCIHKNRGEQIDEYLRDYARLQYTRKRFWRADYVSHYAILDDEDIDSGDDAKPHHWNFFQTDFRKDGLTDAIATRVIGHLNSPSEIGTVYCTAPNVVILYQKHIQGILDGNPFPYGILEGENSTDAVVRLRAEQRELFRQKGFNLI